MFISLELYRIFEAVAQTGSFTHASNSLHLTQSAVSQAIKQLEERLDAKLFLRTKKGAVLTDDGRLLYLHIKKALRSIADAEDYFSKLKSLEGGSLRIGAGDTLCKYFLMENLQKFHASFPGVDIKVTNRTSGETVGLLREGSIDVGFINLPVQDVSGMKVTELSDISDCFVCGRKYYDKFQTPVSFEKLFEYPVLMLERMSRSRRYVDAFLESRGITVKPQIELGSLDLLLEFAANDLGISCVIGEFLGDKADKLRIIPLAEQIPKRKIGMITKKDIPLSLACKEFVKLFGAG